MRVNVVSAMVLRAYHGYPLRNVWNAISQASAGSPGVEHHRIRAVHAPRIRVVFAPKSEMTRLTSTPSKDRTRGQPQ